MITFLEGIVEEKTPTKVVLNVGGLGYELFVPMCCYDWLPELGSQCRLLVHDYVREDQHSLFGFLKQEERGAFEMLMGVGGIGAKLALGALSCLSVTDLKNAILNGDTKTLSSISGIGRKTAERILVELRDRVAKDYIPSADSGQGAGSFLGETQNAVNATLALVSLGYKPADARSTTQKACDALGDSAPVEDIVRHALRGGL